MNTQIIIKNSFKLGFAIILTIVFEAFTYPNSNERFSKRNNDTIACAVEDTIQKSTEKKAYNACWDKIPEGFPTYPYGQDGLKRFISRNLHYPDSAFAHLIEGHVVVNFEINGSGTVCNVRITQSADPYLDEEAVRVVKKMPKWIPGSQEIGNVEFYIPFNFTFH